MSSSSVETVYFDVEEEIQSPLKLIRERFKINKFIPNQRESIEAALNNEDMLLVLPSGPLRNLCYIAPVSVSRCMTIVIVPSSLYLMEQDDYYLQTYRIPYLFITRTATYKNHWISCEQFENKQELVSLLYMTYHEFIRCKQVIKEHYNNKLIHRFVVDEAHCASQWRHEFHFGFLRVVETLKQQFPRTHITAITAIPNERIHIDIINTLHIPQCRIFKKSILL